MKTQTRPHGHDIYRFSIDEQIAIIRAAAQAGLDAGFNEKEIGHAMSREYRHPLVSGPFPRPLLQAADPYQAFLFLELCLALSRHFDSDPDAIQGWLDSPWAQREAGFVTQRVRLYRPWWLEELVMLFRKYPNYPVVLTGPYGL